MAKHIIVPGMLAGLAALVINVVVGYVFMLIPSVAVDYTNPAIMRDWQNPLMAFFYAAPFVQGWILAWVWEASKSLFLGSIWKRGMRFGIVMWLIATVPGMIVTYGCFALTLMTVVSWTVAGLFATIAAGWIFAKLN